MPGQERKKPSMAVLVPLYIYPAPGAWDPLYAAAASHGSVQFTVILNPCSGPCMGSLPDQAYVDEIPKLRSYPNIRTLGYVATHYTQKNIDAVLEEIETYANWPRGANATDLRVDGIFLDETPSTYDAEAYKYLERAEQAVRKSTTFNDRYVAHNPGFISPALFDSGTVLQESYLNLTDLTVVFEETFAKWLEKDTLGALQEHKTLRSKLAVVLHSLPSLSKQVLDSVVGRVEETADWLFLTDVKETDAYYHSFSDIFADVVGAVDEGSKTRRRRRGRR